MLDDPTRAHLVYDAESGAFVGADGEPGTYIVYDEAVQKVAQAASQLLPEVKVRSQQKQSEGEKAADSEKLAAAIE